MSHFMPRYSLIFADGLAQFLEQIGQVCCAQVYASQFVRKSYRTFCHSRSSDSAGSVHRSMIVSSQLLNSDKCMYDVGVATVPDSRIRAKTTAKCWQSTIAIFKGQTLYTIVHDQPTQLFISILLYIALENLTTFLISLISLMCSQLKLRQPDNTLIQCYTYVDKDILKCQQFVLAKSKFIA